MKPLKWIKQLFAKKNHHLETRLKIIAVVNKIKWAVNSELASTIIDAIPGRTDDVILECIRKWIPIILKGMSLSDDGFNAHVAIRQAVGTIKVIVPTERSGIYQGIAGRLYESFTGLPEDTAKIAIQEEYKQWK